MAKKEPTIVVAGDISVDWFMYPVKASDHGENWRLHHASHANVLPGGAALLTDFIEQSLAEEGILPKIQGPQFPKKNLCDISPDEVIHSNVILDNSKSLGNKTAEVLRIKKFLGYIGPPENILPSWYPKSYNIKNSKADIIVLDDAGNGFREMDEAWPKALESFSHSLIIYKMSRPLLEGSLWKKIYENPSENLIVIINSNDLRRTAGIHISKSLSWENTAKDLVFELQRSEALHSLQQCPYLVVLFDTDGAILYRSRNNDLNDAIIVFDPSSLEGAFALNIDGTMMGLMSIFTATLVKQLTKEGFSGLTPGIKQGLANSRALLEIGYKIDNGIKYPSLKEILDESAKYTYISSSIEPPTNLKDSDPHFWRILDHKTRHIRQLVSREIVLKGKAEGLESVPICKFGNLETIDRAEIESYSSIKELIIEFLLNQEHKNPLCFAVFGPPGSGKSFGVKQVLKSIDSNGDRLESISFNISQFRDYHDLVNAFHKVRDIVLSDKVPFVFFDEFDSAYEGLPLGWLKYFLAPMQDGEFKEGEAVHPIGNAIFVFAGGTRHTFEDFVQNLHKNDSTSNLISSEGKNVGQNSVQSVEHAEKEFKDAKGPDFVSRLRGFINVMGPNRQRTKYDDDDAFIIRRAKVLRVLLENEPSASCLFNSKKEICIDDGVLRAMLNVTKYKHGTRSMTALIEMSRLAGKNRFDLSALPVKKQLDMHVDADEFLFLTEKERYQSMLLLRDLPYPEEVSYRRREDVIVESIAKLMYESYMSRRKGEGKESEQDISLDEFKDAVEDIPNKLLAINNGLRKMTSTIPHIPDITGDEIETFARLEYGRLCRNQMFGRLSDGKKNEACNSVFPWLTTFNKLPDDKKDEFRESVYTIPLILQKAGYEIYRMKELEEINDPYIIDRLARLLHAKYVENRKNKGDTPETNPSLVEFDALPQDIKEANFDSIRKIPEKLKWIGYNNRRLQRGEKQKMIRLTRDEIKIMAKREHDRWVWQKIMQGWVYKMGEKNFEKKTTPYIVPWNKLPPDIRVNDCNSVRLIPKLLKEAGYEAYKPNLRKND